MERTPIEVGRSVVDCANPKTSVWGEARDGSRGGCFAIARVLTTSPDEIDERTPERWGEESQRAGDAVDATLR